MNDKTILQAVELLKAGQLVAVPTETVYGLAADAQNPKAVEAIFTLKGRPNTQPLSLLIPNNAPLSRWAIDIPKQADSLTQKYWPGPLTLILKKANWIPDVITASGETIGLRCPDHPILQKILEHFPYGLAAPSANRFGEKSPQNAQDVMQVFGNDLNLIIDGGPCKIGTASTILDLTTTPAKILRQGTLVV